MRLQSMRWQKFLGNFVTHRGQTVLPLIECLLIWTFKICVVRVNLRETSRWLKIIYGFIIINSTMTYLGMFNIISISALLILNTADEYFLTILTNAFH